MSNNTHSVRLDDDTFQLLTANGKTLRDVLQDAAQRIVTGLPTDQTKAAPDPRQPSKIQVTIWYG